MVARVSRGSIWHPACSWTSPDDVTDVVCTHLHPDHVGWLFDLESRPSFPRATIWFGAGDWRYFIEGRPTPLIQDHVHQGFRSHASDAARYALLLSCQETVLMTPRHVDWDQN